MKLAIALLTLVKMVLAAVAVVVAIFAFSYWYSNIKEVWALLSSMACLFFVYVSVVTRIDYD